MEVKLNIAGVGLAERLLHSYATFWQYADSGSNPGDQDEFNGSMAGLKAYDILLIQMARTKCFFFQYCIGINGGQADAEDVSPRFSWAPAN